MYVKLKQCSNCKKCSEISRFSFNPNTLDKKASWCRKCGNAGNAAYYKNNKESCDNRTRKWQSSENNKHILRQRRLIKEFNITQEEYVSMLESQGNCCAICKTPASNFEKRMAIDHCHRTGKIRGILCNSCNLGLGCFKDSLDYLDKAIMYLRR